MIQRTPKDTIASLEKNIQTAGHRSLPKSLGVSSQARGSKNGHSKRVANIHRGGHKKSDKTIVWAVSGSHNTKDGASSEVRRGEISQRGIPAG